MALILDKSITGTTIVDESGTTITGYTNLSYETNSGIKLENPYLVIDEVTINKYNKYIKITTFLFKDNDGRNTGKLQLENNNYMVHNNNELYDMYFLVSDINIFESSYKYIKENVLINWKSDE
jgi:hypothetical protein